MQETEARLLWNNVFHRKFLKVLYRFLVLIMLNATPALPDFEKILFFFLQPKILLKLFMIWSIGTASIACSRGAGGAGRVPGVWCDTGDLLLPPQCFTVPVLAWPKLARLCPIRSVKRILHVLTVQLGSRSEPNTSLFIICHFSTISWKLPTFSYRLFFTSSQNFLKTSV